MAVDHRIIRSAPFKGLNKTTPKVELSNAFSSDLKNASLRDTGDIEKRKGFHTVQRIDKSAVSHPDADNLYTTGIFEYTNISNDDGSVSKELLRVHEGELEQLVTATNGVTVNVSTGMQGSNPIGTPDQFGVTSNFRLDETTNTFKFTVSSFLGELRTVDLGTGYEAGDMTRAQFSAAMGNIEIPISQANGTFTVSDIVSLPLGAVRFKISNFYWLIDVTDWTYLIGVPTYFIITDPVSGFIYAMEILSSDITTGTIEVYHTNPYSATVVAQASTSWGAYADAGAGSGSDPAAFMSIDKTIVEPDGSSSQNVETYTQYGWEAITTNTPFGNINQHATNITSTSQLKPRINICQTSLNNVVYFSDGFNNVLKYDGNSTQNVPVYRAGLPVIPRDPDDPLAFTSSDITSPNGATGGGMTNGTRTYKIQFEFTDKKGNIVSSCTSSPIEVTNSSGTTTNKNIISWLKYYNQFAGVGTLDDRFQGFNTEASVVGVTLSSSDATYQAFSQARKNRTKLLNEKSLRVKIWRTRDHSPGATGQFYLLSDDPWDVSGRLFADTTSDDDLNDLGGSSTVLINPDPQHQPPPKGQLMISHRGLLVISGNLTNVNNVVYSLPFNSNTQEIGSEYFPAANGVVVESPFGSKINAINSLGDFMYVFHDESVSIVAGEIESQELPAVNLITKEGGVGCKSHFSVLELQNKLFFMSDQGVYSVSPQGLTEESLDIKTVFNKAIDFTAHRTIAFNWLSQSKLVFCIPKEKLYVQNFWKYRITDDTLVIVYDYAVGAWFIWEGIDFTSGVATHKDKIFFAPQKALESTVNVFSEAGIKGDYNDHAKAIDFSYATNWESMGEPTIPKKFLRLKTYALDTDNSFESAGFTLNVGVQREFIEADIANISFDFGSSNKGYGDTAWDEFSYGEAIPYMFRSKLPSSKTKCLRLNFTNSNVNENVLLSSYELEIALPYGTEIK